MKDRAKYIKIFISRQNNNKLKTCTIKRKSQTIEDLLDYLCCNDIESLLEVRCAHIYDYLNSKSLRSATKSNYQFVIREFFDIMYKEKLSSISGHQIYPTIFTNKRDTILSYYSNAEIKSMIDNLDLCHGCGIRNKCMITIAAQTGLRASDVVWLKFDEIDWDKNTISKVQYKTKIPVVVTFSDYIKFLMVDYIKNHRPNNNSEYIFLNTITGKQFNDSAVLTHIVRHAFIQANIDITNKKAGAHSLRHSLATNLLLDNTPMPIIKGVLGHTTVDTTQKYISIDINGLRSVSLEAPPCR